MPVFIIRRMGGDIPEEWGGLHLIDRCIGLKPRKMSSTSARKEPGKRRLIKTYIERSESAALKDEKGTTYQWLARGLRSQVFALTSLLDLTLVFPPLFTDSKVPRTTP